LTGYALLYRRVLASLGARLSFWLAARVTLASFLGSHVTPFGSATGTLVNVSTLEARGIAASTTGEAIGLTSLVSRVALTLVAITVGFGAPRATGVIALLGYRVVNYWLPLLPGAVAYLRLRLNLNKTDKATSPAQPADSSQAGRGPRDR